MPVSLTRLQNFYGEFPTHLLLRKMIREEFVGNIGLLTSFGADSGLMLALVAEVDKSTPILFIDTEKHFPQTLQYGKDLIEQFGLTNVHYLKPDPEMLGRIDESGDLWQSQPNRCCWLRKVEPLNRAIEELGLLAIVTGRKRYQTKERSEMETIEIDENGIFRINPLADWTKERQKEEVAKRNIPPHPLIAEGYKSIGCMPCTAKVGEGEDERAGRWSHTLNENGQKSECGLHLPAKDTDWSV